MTRANLGNYSSVENNTPGFAVTPTVKMNMISTIFKYHKIFNIIVFSIFVSMVNSFRRFKIPLKMFFEYEAMFCNITSFARKWMFWLMNIDISSTCDFPTFPTRVFSTRTTHFLSRLFRMFFAIHRIIFAFIVSHFSSLIKKALFGGLSRTVKFSHLVRAFIIDIKNLFPISNISISCFLNDVNGGLIL